MLIGLTGTFGCGKSTVAGMLAEMGADVIDADVLAREAVAPGRPEVEAIRRRFGDEYVDAEGRIDRRRLAALVFDSPSERRALNAIVHPYVVEEMRRRAGVCAGRARAEGRMPLVVLDVPLLFEEDLLDGLEATVVVTIATAERFHRVRRRDGLSERQIVERLAAQWPQRLKAARADRKIDNSGSMESTRLQVGALWQEWMEKATSGGQVSPATTR